MAKDLRSFVRTLKASGDLVEIDRPVRPQDFEVTALLSQMEDWLDPPAVLFSNPTGVDDRPAAQALLTNVYASRRRCALMLDEDPAETRSGLGRAFAARAAGKLQPIGIPGDEAPVREVVLTGRDVDVARLPIVRHFEMDLGPVLTMTHIMRAPEGFYDISFAKTFYVWEAREMVVSIHTRDLGLMLKAYAELGRPAPIVNVLGHHPAFHLGSLAPNPWGANDYETLGSFLGERLRLTPSVTWGEDFMVPADAELIIEGEIAPGRLGVCDPFGEVARLYQAQCLRPVLEVKAVTSRKGAIVQDIFSGFRDCFALGAVPKEAALETRLRKRFPNLGAVHVPDSGCGVFAAYISIDDAAPGVPHAIGQAAIELVRVIQCVVVVDGSIDVFNEQDVIWAVHTYASLKDGLALHPPRSGSDPGVKAGFATTNWGGKVVIDATRPTGFSFGARSQVPADVVARVKLSDYLPKGGM